MERQPFLQECSTKGILGVVRCLFQGKISSVRVFDQRRVRHKIKTCIRENDIHGAFAFFRVSNCESKIWVHFHQVLMDLVIDQVHVGFLIPNQTKGFLKCMTCRYREIDIWYGRVNKCENGRRKH